MKKSFIENVFLEKCSEKSSKAVQRKRTGKKWLLENRLILKSELGSKLNHLYHLFRPVSNKIAGWKLNIVLAYPRQSAKICYVGFTLKSNFRLVGWQKKFSRFFEILKKQALNLERSHDAWPKNTDWFCLELWFVRWHWYNIFVLTALLKIKATQCSKSQFQKHLPIFFENKTS